MDYLATYANKADGMTGLVYAWRFGKRDGFAAALRDDDAGRLAPGITFFERFEEANAYAQRLASGVAQ